MEVWNQVYNPLSNIWLSALVAALPIILFFSSLVFFKLKGWVAAFITVLLSLIIAIFVYKMPILTAVFSFVQGFLTGLWPIAWIVLAAIFLYKISVKSGHFEVLKSSIMSISPDHRIQVILIAFCFGAFLEGAIGFGAPVAISAALLLGLGFKPLQAAGLSMIANTAGAAFGAVGIPVLALAKSVGYNAEQLDNLTTMVVRMIPVISFLLPFLLVVVLDGLRGLRQTFVHVLFISLSFVVTQYLVGSNLGPELTDIISAIVSIVVGIIAVKTIKIKNIFRVEGSGDSTAKMPNFGEVIKAWLPFIFLILFIFIWNIKGVKEFLSFANIKFEMPFLHNLIAQSDPIADAAIIASGKNILSGIYVWEILKATGTAVLFAAILGVIVLRVKFSIVKEAAVDATKEMFIPIITIGLVVAYAFLAKSSGQAATMGLALSATGNTFAFFSPIIGWLGVFLTGSVTSSNLLFGGLQQVTAHQLNIQEVIFLAANTMGGVVGKIISPQSIAVACAAVGLVGQEGKLFKFTLKYSLFFVIIASIITFLMVNGLNFLVPK